MSDEIDGRARSIILRCSPSFWGAETKSPVLFLDQSKASGDLGIAKDP
jgi:hypothetical protein